MSSKQESLLLLLKMMAMLMICWQVLLTYCMLMSGDNHVIYQNFAVFCVCLLYTDIYMYLYVVQQ